MTDYAAKHSWWLDAARLRVGLLKRPQPKVPHMTLPKWQPEIAELEQFTAWLLWADGGKKGPRPSFHKKVPPWAWTVLGEYSKAHPKPKPKPPKPPDPPKPKPSWTMPSPLVMSGVYGDNDWQNDPNTGQPHAGIGTIGQIVVPGVCPLWRCDSVVGPARTGWLGQIEGEAQLDTALELLADKPAGDSKAIVGTGNVPAQRMVAAGVNVAFYELNMQSGAEPYGNTARLLFQGHQDGWPHVFPSYGCYVPVGLEDYATYVPQVWSTEAGGFVPGTQPQGIADYFAVFSGQGMGDTGSWPYLAAL